MIMSDVLLADHDQIHSLVGLSRPVFEKLLQSAGKCVLLWKITIDMASRLGRAFSTAKQIRSSAAQRFEFQQPRRLMSGKRSLRSFYSHSSMRITHQKAQQPAMVSPPSDKQGVTTEQELLLRVSPCSLRQNGTHTQAKAWQQ